MNGIMQPAGCARGPGISGGGGGWEKCDPLLGDVLLRLLLDALFVRCPVLPIDHGTCQQGANVGAKSQAGTRSLESCVRFKLGRVVGVRRLEQVLDAEEDLEGEETRQMRLPVLRSRSRRPHLLDRDCWSPGLFFVQNRQADRSGRVAARWVSCLAMSSRLQVCADKVTHMFGW